MIRILHYYKPDDVMVSMHVAQLQKGMGHKTESHSATTLDDARILLRGSHYDILHIHGCWQGAMRSLVNMARQKGTRIIVTPHGQLEPWVRKDNYLRDKLPKQLLFQRSIISRAWVVIVQGSMEEECIEQLGWMTSTHGEHKNGYRRLVTIRNSVVTVTITPEEMAIQTYQIYQKVMDSDTRELLNDEQRMQLRNIIKAGITGDPRWLEDDGHSYPSRVALTSYDDWRRVMLYAHHEEITPTIQHGLRVLGIDAPEIDVEHIDYYQPDNYKETVSIQQMIGNQFATENERLIATFRVLRKLTTAGVLSIKHLIEMDRELREHKCQEEELEESLKDRQLWRLAGRMMQLMKERTGLTEGYMPLRPINDRRTRHILYNIDHHMQVTK